MVVVVLGVLEPRVDTFAADGLDCELDVVGGVELPQAASVIAAIQIVPPARVRRNIVETIATGAVSSSSGV